MRLEFQLSRISTSKLVLRLNLCLFYNKLILIYLSVVWLIYLFKRKRIWELSNLSKYIGRYKLKN
jgi:hypothetical protein